MELLITRPEADSHSLIEALEKRGHHCHLVPLMQIAFLDGPELNLDDVQALLATSANGVRALAHRTKSREKPLYAVGDATMREARALGFAEVHSAAGDVVSLAALVAAALRPDDGALVHAAGETLAGDLGGALNTSGFEYRRETLYQAVAVTSLPVEICDHLVMGRLGGVLLYSPRTARIFADRLTAAGLEGPASDLVAFCLSQAVADAIGAFSMGETVIAEEPNQTSLLAAIDDYEKSRHAS